MLLYIVVVGSISFVFQHVHSIAMLNKPEDFMNSVSDTIIANYINSKGYLPKDLDLPKSTIVNDDTDVTFLLSKLSDQELIQLLNEQPKKAEYNLNDILKINYNSKNNQKSISDQEHYDFNGFKKRSHLNNRFQKLSDSVKTEGPVFRLENKEINPYAEKYDSDPKYTAVQKLHNLLYSRPQPYLDDNIADDEEKKELLFDVLVAQLKTLCCKRTQPQKEKDKSFKIKGALNDIIPRGTIVKNPSTNEQDPNNVRMPPEFIFLIINDEVNSNAGEELIYVDPESLKRNSSVLLLGPVTNQMTDAQLKLVMSRISNELSRPEYLPLFTQLSNGRLEDENSKLVESLITGPDTRRYIKPHRCNHQSKLAKIYGGPKWLICTGYLNLNMPSLYD